MTRVKEIASFVEGEVNFEGTTASGAKFTLTGEVESVGIASKYDELSVDELLDSARICFQQEEFYLKFKIKKNGEQYRVKMETVDVERIARILADDRTTAAYEAARVRCGAPEHAKIRQQPFMTHGSGELTLEDVDKPNPIMLEFYWNEKVVKR